MTVSADTGEFPGQFIITGGSETLPQHFRSFTLSKDEVLAADERLQVVQIRTGGSAVGWLLGYPIDRDRGAMLRGPLDLVAEVDRSFSAISEAVLNRLAGSFLAVVVLGAETQVFPDADATMGLVYEPGTRRAASSAELLLQERYFEALDHDLIAAFDAKRDGWFTAGLTAHRGVFRLLPNHALSLSSYQARRHWPATLPAYEADTRKTVRAIGEEVARSTAAIIQEGPAVCALTGGFETRALLAANRDNRQAMSWVTVATPGSALDLELARRLVRISGIEHRTLRAIKATPRQMEQWTKGAGHALGGMNQLYHPAVAPLAGLTLVGGLGGEVGRGFLWPADLAADTPIDAGYLLNRLKLPAHPMLMERVTDWLGGLQPGLDAFQTLDLAYVELRMGPWAFGQGYQTGGPVSQHPLISRAQFLRMWSLPPEFRRESGMMRALITEFWPELTQVPINAYGDWRDRIEVIRKALRRPDRAWRKAKQIAREKAFRGATRT